MWCPKCYGGMNRKSGMCLHCGFRFSDLEGATNEKARIAKKEGKKEDVVYTDRLPEDVKKKTLLLYSIFLGLFGAHNYYVGKFKKAIFMTTIFVIHSLFATLYSYKLGGSFISYFYTTVAVIQGVSIIMWVLDVIYIIINRFKVPVYKEEFSKKR